MAKHHKLYKISCAKCGCLLVNYKKFGAGKGILRLYMSNISFPESMVNVQENYSFIKNVPNLTCTECEEVIGLPDLSKSGKWVFRLKQGYFHRKLIKG